MNSRRINYREAKLKQKRDLTSHIAGYYIYRHFSTPFTWAFVNFGISANSITISSFFLCILGFYFLSKGTYAYMILGLLFFIFFKIFDMSDGEVARLRNETSLEGIYFDRISHYIYSCCLGLGLGFGLYRLHYSNIYLILGFLFTLGFILENAINDILKSVLREGIINKNRYKKIFNYLQKQDKYYQQRLIDNTSKYYSWAKSNIFSKLVAIYPFQGLIYSDTFTTPILIILFILEPLISIFAGLPIIYENTIGVIPMYLFIVSISKIIWIIWFIYNMEKYRHITTTLNKV